jgi:hypothetical protein
VRRGPTNGKSRLSVNRSIPMPDLLADELRAWQKTSARALPDDVTFAHPRLGTSLDGAKVTRKFQDACRAAGVQVVRTYWWTWSRGARCLTSSRCDAKPARCWV